MKKLSIILLIFAVCGQLNAQVMIQAGARVSTVGDVHIVFDNINVTNNDTASDFSSSFITCKGMTNTILDGSGKWVMKKLIVDKGTAVLQLGAPMQMNNSVQFLSGQLDLNGQILTLASGALLENESESARIIGPAGGVVQTTVNAGIPYLLNPGGLGVALSSNQDLGSITVRRWHNGQPGRTAIDRFYEVSPQNNTGLIATLRLHYFDAELNNIAEDGLALYTRPDAASPWNHLAADVKNAQLNYVEKTPGSLKAQYSISAPGGTLPLIWGPVNANCKGSAAELKWTTMQEHNVKHFVVEKSTNRVQWSEIATVPAKGTLGSSQMYSYTDGAVTTTAMFRIRSVDLDGRTQFSPVVQSKGCNEVFSSTITPLPAREKATLSINSPLAFATEIKVVGADGKIYQRLSVQLSAGYNQITLHLDKLTAGNYYVVLQTPDGLKTLGLIMQ